MDFCGFSKFSTSLDERFCEKTLSAVPLPVGNQKFMFRELGAPSKNRCDKRRVEGLVLFITDDRSLPSRLQVKPSAEL
jgi:hypothetical protein